MRADPHESNGTIDERQRRQKNMRAEHGCTLCPPNRGENAGRKPRHGAKKAKHKQHKRKA